MCQIIYKKAGKKFNFEAMDKAQQHNEDGYGVMWYEDNVAKAYTTMNYEAFKRVLAAIEDHTCVAHLRYTTVGGNSLGNCHPFEVPTGYMMHNGTISSLNSTTSSKSDSSKLADLIYDCSFENVKDIKPLIQHIVGTAINRVVFLEDSGEVTIINEGLGMWEEGIWYSNDYHKKDSDWCRFGGCSTNKGSSSKKITKTPDKVADPSFERVFVYGTLKKGYGNHRLLKHSKYIGKAVTTGKWAMIGEDMSFPYLLDEDEVLGHNIVGEVYEVTKFTKGLLDRLEGTPTHYHEEEIEVEYANGITETVGVYVKTEVTVTDLAQTFIPEFTRRK